MRNNLPVTDKEVVVSDKQCIVSKTDLKGIITYANRDFVEISGYSEAELIGQPHNLVRHPDMPAAGFEDLWRDLKAGRPWIGIVKNRCKNGDYYWVEAHASPVWENDQIVGYISVRRKPTREQIEAAAGVYRAVNENRAQGLAVSHGQAVSTSFFSRLGQRIRDMPIALRFLLPSVATLALVMALTTLFLGNQISNTLTQTGETELSQKISLVRNTAEATLEALERDANRALEQYAARYPGSFSLDGVENNLPQLRYGKNLVNGHHEEEDTLARLNRSAAATLYGRRDNELVAIATSLKNDKGEYVLGQSLAKDHAAKLLAGQRQGALTATPGKERLAALKPIKDESGKVIGAFSVSLGIAEEMKSLKDKIKAVKIGDSGYIYVVNALAGPQQGELIVHPAKEGANILAAKDASGREFIREMVNQRQGIIHYPWQNAELGETSPRQKVVAFETMEKWQVLIGGGTYTEEFDSLSRKFNGILGTASLLVVIILGLIMAWVTRKVITDRLSKAVETLKAISAGHYDQHVDIIANDELGQLMQGLEAMQCRMGYELIETKRQADEMTRIKIGLDNVATNVRIADLEGHILYVNKALQATFERDREGFRRTDPNFDPSRIVGYNVGGFYADPQAALQRLRNLSTATHSQMQLGSRQYKVTTTPILNDKGERLGSVGEWVDITDQLNAQDLLTGVIRKAADGDFSARLNLESRDPFFAQIEELINQLLSTGEGALTELSKVLSAIAEGDLTRSITSHYSGVFGQLKQDTNATVDSLQDIISNIKEATEAINTAAHEIASGNSDLSARTEEQASSLEETSSSMEQLNSTVKQNAENANRAQELAVESNTMAVRGGDMVRRIVTTMSDIQDSSHRIADIISVIDSIAFQTNILALNAAVEAARAGEQGRGFAVVASEVRALAQKSAEASQEIRDLITTSVAKVDGGASLVKEAGSTIDEVVRSFEKVSALVNDIANASREQSAGIEQVTLAVGQMDEVTQQNAALVEEAAAAAESLEDQARMLADSVSRFRLNANAPQKKLAPKADALHIPASEGSVPKKTVAPVKALPNHSLDDEWAEF